MAKCLMVQGTSSNAGKSVLVAALCRIFSNEGYKVAPFKAQNMSLNSYTTSENGEIAIAQVFQAEAARCKPSIHMNPILIKAKDDFTSQFIVQGKALKEIDYRNYENRYSENLKAIKESLDILKSENDIIIIEGAGSASEINLRKNDLANMGIAHLADCNVLLISDIELGGVFASIAGTFLLLSEEDTSRLKGVIINKFRGNKEILMPGVLELEKIIKTPVLGILPFSNELHIPEEDSASLDKHKFKTNQPITIGVIRLPRISNFTDIDPLEAESDVGIRLIELNDSIGNVDAIIIPGTRNSTKDLIELKKSGLADEIIAKSKEIPIVGICGGYQIMGRKIIDDECRESEYGTQEGLALLDITTSFNREEKVVERSSGYILNGFSDKFVEGYELHEATTTLGNVKPFIKLDSGFGNDSSRTYDGAISGEIFGTYFHGIFNNYEFRCDFLNKIRVKKGLDIIKSNTDPYLKLKEESIEKLASLVLDNIDIGEVKKLLK